MTRKQALRLAGITPQQLVAWEKLGYFPPQESYEQRDLVMMKNLRTLRAAGVPYERLARFLETLQQRTGKHADPLHDLRLRRHGRKLAVHWQGQQMEAETGQLLLELEPADLKAILAFPQKAEKRQEDEKKKQASEIFYRALERENQGASSEEVVPLYQEALRLDAQCFGAHLNLGTIFFNQKRMRLAEQHYKRAIEIHPAYVLAHFNLASLYDEQGRMEKAIECYHKALELDGKYVDAHYNLALLYQNLGRTMEAARHWKTFLKLDPSSEWAHIARRELRRLIEHAVVPGTGVRRAEGGEPAPAAEAAGGAVLPR